LSTLLPLSWSGRPNTERKITYLIAICGTLLSLPLLLFAWIGAQTFIREGEKAIAVAIFWLSAGLLALSLLTFLHPHLATWDALAVGAALIIYLGLWIAGKLTKPKQ